MKDQFERLSVALRGRYTLLRQLGKGGMGTVYLARDVKLGREVAVKALLPEVRAAFGDERFQLEVQLVARFSHPNIVKLFEAGEAEGIPFYVMDFVEGESLQQHLEREGQIGLKRALRIAAEIGDALQYAHEHGTIHRDIKPGNILLSGDHALLTDFGIAKKTTSDGSETLTDTGVAIGTAAYMSPEQASGDKRVDARSDVYSLAAVLYEMLAGEPPFTGKTYQAIVARVMMDAPRPLRTTRSSVPAHVEQAILAALAKSPADRPATAKDFLARLAAGQGVRRMSPRRTLVIAGALLVTVGLGIWAGWGVLGGDAPAVLGQNSVAVLYLDNLSGDSSNTYLADGLTEELIARLGQSRLVVKPRSSVRRYRGDAAGDPVTMGRVLGVAYLLSGSVRGGSNRVRVTVELIRAETGTRIWGDSYDITNTDPVDMEQQIAIAVAIKLAGQLSGAERISMASFPTKSREAYDHFLRGLHYMGPRDEQGLFRALDEFDTAARIDPAFAQAYARTGMTCVLILYQGTDSVTAPRLLAKGATAIDRALQLDSTIADAWLGRGRLIAMKRGPFDDGVLASYRRAIALESSNADAHHFYGVALLNTWADWARALPALRRAAALEPDRVNTLNMLGSAEFSARNVPEALRWWDSVVALQPSANTPALRGAVINRASARLAILGDTLTSRQDAAELVRLGNEAGSHGILALLEWRRGDSVAARAQFDTLWRTSDFSGPGKGCGPLEAVVLVAMNARERALSCIELADPTAFVNWFPYLHFPFFDAIRDEPRFRKVLERLGPPRPLTRTPEN